ncbi:putative mitochondrial ras-related protein rab-5 [Balamuthia mandrillaris]
MSDSGDSDAVSAGKVASVDAKIVLLGDTGVGKTSLALRFVQDSFSSRTAPTVGAAFLTKVLLIEDCKIKLRIWDTAGQERFRSLAPMYYRGACAAVLVYDITREESYRKMCEWVEELHINLSEDIVKIVVGNKYDLEKYRNVPRNKAESFAKSIGALAYIETSAKTGEGVEEVFTQLAHRLNEKRMSMPLDSPETSANGGGGFGGGGSFGLGGRDSLFGSYSGDSMRRLRSPQQEGGGTGGGGCCGGGGGGPSS